MNTQVHYKYILPHKFVFKKGIVGREDASDVKQPMYYICDLLLFMVGFVFYGICMGGTWNALLPSFIIRAKEVKLHIKRKGLREINMFEITIFLISPLFMIKYIRDKCDNNVMNEYEKKLINASTNFLTLTKRDKSIKPFKNLLSYIGT